MVVRDDNLHTNKFRNNNLHEMIHCNNLQKHCHKHKFANDWPGKIICKVFKRYAEQQFVKKKVVRSYNLQVENLQIHKTIYKEDKCGIRVVYLVYFR